jgi:DNA polymerase-3 subunit alpha
MGEFTHLHVHTQYSLLDGAIRVKDLFPTLKARGMDTVAVTDHGNMFGAIDLYTEAKAHDVKLIFGCETYVAAADLRTAPTAATTTWCSWPRTRSATRTSRT